MKKKIGSYIIDTKSIDSLLTQKNMNQVFLQLPEGLHQYVVNIINWLEETYQVTILLDANPNYGSCDLPSEDTLKQINVQAIIQIGHLPIPSMQAEKRSIPTLFVNAQSTLPVLQTVKKSLTQLTGKHIGIVTTAQHLHHLDQIIKILEKNEFTPIIEKGDNRLFSSGQVLGCNFTAATSITKKVDSFLFVGTGFFHALGLLLATNKPVVIADPYTNQVLNAQNLQEKKQQLLRQRYGAIAFAKQAKRIAVIIGLKPGQIRYDYALRLQQKIKDSGKQGVLLAAEIISPSFIDRFPFVDVFVSTACPRIAIDDYNSYKKPILTPIELEVALQEKEWDEYVFDEIYE